jgi:hypothetical protein
MKNQKYIVEAPIPKPGQTVSSGGIREKGRITVQYSNPIPYKEPPNASSSIIQDKKPASYKDTITDISKVFIFDVADMLWQYILAPVIRAKLHQLGQQMSSHISSTSQSSKVIDSKIIDTDNHSSKIVQFPNCKAG